MEPTEEDIEFTPFSVLGAQDIPFSDRAFTLAEAEALLSSPVIKRKEMPERPTVPVGRRGRVIAITPSGNGAAKGYGILVDWCGGEVWQYDDPADFQADAHTPKLAAN